jgi:flagellar biosynthesis/type III secretory pathway protein FliH
LNVFGDVLRSQVVTHIELSEDDYQFFEANKEKFEINVDLSEIKVEINKDLEPGDVLFSNDLGILDGTLQSRFEILRQIVTGLER